ncbi:NAD-dependent epimerase/dehydratase family protein [Nocardia huaxiensis]|uniref:NAD-dependent epimerase/dehydratase family protein n=1 Tax=Nocardia huaxiensis TaxID=2755382 RepID=A0A7D6V8L9_9NOCA|nr:NAD-dependent epimerase/dehydratase family protein [Nocardia huaxiensis]QLY29414.1 NAD-dependent epimerase/dehydratase family protein [Nocardia huaxiensis]UFS97104.1 NAD-dependent epimerase/dehydratase family protein [Nocardia huaxiensis]
MRILVLGGYGAVGRPLVAELRRAGDTVVVAGRDPARADIAVDLTDPGLHSYRRAVEGIDVVVNAAGVEDPRLAEQAAACGAAFADITASTEYVALLEKSMPDRPVIVSVGLAPGLTNLLAAAVHARSPEPIDIAVLLGAGEPHGVAATDWTYRLLGRTFRSGGERVRNYTRPRVFTLPGHGRRRLVRADFSDQHVLTRDLGVRVRTHFALDSRVATAALALATWIPGAAAMPRGLPMPGADEWIVLARTPSGHLAWARGRGQSRATALLTVAAIRASVDLAPGVHHLHNVLTLADLSSIPDLEIGTSPVAVP